MKPTVKATKMSTVLCLPTAVTGTADMALSFAALCVCGLQLKMASILTKMGDGIERLDHLRLVVFSRNYRKFQIFFCLWIGVRLCKKCPGFQTVSRRKSVAELLGNRHKMYGLSGQTF